MKRQIRRNVFETNSSSMHSLVIKKDSEYVTYDEAMQDMWLDKDGLMKIYGDSIYYGRSPFQILLSMIEKATYVLASKSRHKNDDTYNEVVNAIRSVVPEFKDFELDFEVEQWRAETWTEQDMERMYGKGNFTLADDKWVVWGYDVGQVDEDILSGFLEKENISIKEFITNKKYIVIVDGDEYCIYKNMKKSGLINIDNIEKEYTPSFFMED